MSVSRHLNIAIDEYDERIRSFVPHYERLIAFAAAALRFVDSAAPTIVDLGVGTGALSAACRRMRPACRLVGIDSDASMLAAARDRLGSSDVELLEGDFLESPLPPCDAIVACLALHHVRTREAKQALYRRCREVLRPGGLLVSADHFSAREPRVAAQDREAWLRHLRTSYTAEDAEAHLSSWADEDVYFPLAEELLWIQAAGLEPEVLWREGGFAVVAGLVGEDPAS